MKKIIFYSVQDYEITAITSLDIEGFKITTTKEKLNNNSSRLSINHHVVVVFSKDKVDETIINDLNSYGVKLICTRSTGYDNIDLLAASSAGIAVANVPSYSPESIAEHSVMLMLALCKHLKKSVLKTQVYNFDLNDMISKNLGELTIGILGTGNIGMSAISILNGFGSRIIAYDIKPDYRNAKQLGFQYCDMSELLACSDIIGLYLPLTPDTEYILNRWSIRQMRKSSIIVNVGRGKLLDTQAALAALGTGQLAGLGLDVYENEKNYFFSDHSKEGVTDEILKRLIHHPRVILTGHQAFLTETSIKQRINITKENIENYFDLIVTNNFLTGHRIQYHYNKKKLEVYEANT